MTRSVTAFLVARASQVFAWRPASRAGWAPGWRRPARAGGPDLAGGASRQGERRRRLNSLGFSSRVSVAKLGCSVIFPLLVSVSESLQTVVVKCQGNFAFATDLVPAGGGNGGELVGERCLFPFFFGRVEWVGARESLISSAFCCTSGHQTYFVRCL